jgi:Transposase Tn5 dimerisation domain
LLYQARQQPDAPCDTVLQTHEWQALYCTIHSQPIPPHKPPSLQQAVRWIAQLGGFLGRRHDGEPGVKTIWRGWQRLQDIAATWQLLHSPQGTQPQL